MRIFDVTCLNTKEVIQNNIRDYIRKGKRVGSRIYDRGDDDVIGSI